VVEKRISRRMSVGSCGLAVWIGAVADGEEEVDGVEWERECS